MPKHNLALIVEFPSKCLLKGGCSAPCIQLGIGAKPLARFAPQTRLKKRLPVIALWFSSRQASKNKRAGGSLGVGAAAVPGAAGGGAGPNVCGKLR